MVVPLTSHELHVITHLLTEAGSLSAQDSCLILFDESTATLVGGFVQQAEKLCPRITKAEIPMANRHGAEPPEFISQLMKKQTIVISLTKYSLAHTIARINATHYGARFLSIPMYDQALLNEPALLFAYKQQGHVVRTITNFFDHGNQVQITSAAGTNITLNISGRTGNCCPGYVISPGELGSPPDIESNISPIETDSLGVVVIDGSITCPELGLLVDPIYLEIVDGFIVNITSDNSHYVTILEKMLGSLGSKRRVLAECGVGLNPAAKLTGNMLTDEGSLGCLHFGFGSNSTVGGINKVDFHLDFVFRDASLFVDKQLIIDQGSLVI